MSRSSASDAVVAGRGTGWAPATDGADPRRQLAPAERLGDVVVGAELEPEDAVELVATGGEHDDRDGPALAQLAADVTAVDVRQAEVEQDEVVASRRQGVGAGGDVDDLMPVGLQAGDERLGDRPVVLDEQQLHAHIVEDCATSVGTVGRIGEDVGRFLDVAWPPPGRRPPTVAGKEAGRMKAPSARVAMLLSIGGVLAAGSAAALVNSQVLEDQSGGAPASATAVSSSSAPPVTTVSDDAPSRRHDAGDDGRNRADDCGGDSRDDRSTAATEHRLATSAPTTAPAVTAPRLSTQATYGSGNAGTALLDTLADGSPSCR